MQQQTFIFSNMSELSGNFIRRPETISIGDIKDIKPCIELVSENDLLSFSFMLSGNEEHVLNLEELHHRDDAAFAYEIFLNDSPVYFRTMEPLCNALFPMFIKLPPFNGNIRLTIKNCSDTPVRFTRAFLYSGLTSLAEEYNLPMQLGLCFPKLKYNDFDQDLKLFKNIKQGFNGLHHFTITIGNELPYMIRSDEENYSHLDYVLRLAAASNVDITFNFNSWWGGTPTGRDGNGGYFNDVEYNQVVYDPLTGKCRLSVPNMWSDIPWYTMTHPHLNKVRKLRLQKVLKQLGLLSAMYRKHSKEAPRISIFIDNEPTYWAQYAYSNSPDCGGDYNATAIASAKNDGVDLQPDGAVTEPERRWLLKNLSDYMSDLSHAFHEASTEEYAYVSDDQTSFGEHFLTENTYTHVFPNAHYPYMDIRHPQFEAHVTKWARLGIECAGFQDDRILSYAAATGRFGQVNAERCCYDSPLFHHQLYAHGAVCDNIFNYYYDTDTAQIAGLDKLDGLTYPETAYGRQIMSYRVFDDRITGGSILARENMESGPLREYRVLRPEKLGTGSITFSAGSKSDFPYGGFLEIYGLVRPQNGGIRLYAGGRPEQLVYICELPEHNADYQVRPIIIDLTKITQTIKDRLYIKLEITSNFYDDWAQRNAIWSIRMISYFENKTGYKADSDFTLCQYRALSLLVSYRADCERLLAAYPGCVTPEITFLYKEGRYKAAYQQLMHEISINKTDRFLVEGSGRLGKYGLSVDSGKQAVELFLCTSTQGYEITLYAKPGTRAVISGTETGIGLTRLSINRYLIHNGTSQSVSVMIEKEFSESSFCGTFLGYDKDSGKLKVSCHDAAVTGYQPYLFLSGSADIPVEIKASPVAGTLLDHISTNPYTPAAIINARIDSPASMSSLRTGDYLKISIHNGAVSSIAATRGLARGKITSIEPLSLLGNMHNAFVMIETAPEETVRFELGAAARLNYLSAPSDTMLTAGESALGLEPGDIVLISFEPEPYGSRPFRAMEITKI